jgi:LAO/AO transport system kinase
MNEVLIEQMRAGNRRALARLISIVEQGDAESLAIQTQLYPSTGRAHTVGITGPPGVGKSTLVSALTHGLRQQQRTVAILAVDPSSPRTGGAILGDRIRMQDHTQDTGVFIRSMASRGQHGGLAQATAAVVDVLDAAGFDMVLIETVGAGQSEVAISAMAQTTLVVEAPGFGDDIQAMKAGLLEVADLFVVNKADHEGAEATRRHLLAAMQLGEQQANAWRPPIVQTIASQQQGIHELIEAIQRHKSHLDQQTLLPSYRHQRAEQAIEQQLWRLLLEQLAQTIPHAERQALIERVAAREIAPITAAAALWGQLRV